LLRASHFASPPSVSMQLNWSSTFAPPIKPLAVLKRTHQSFLPSVITFAAQPCEQPEPSLSVMKLQSYSFLHWPFNQVSAYPLRDTYIAK
jgi:hypothetical protein